MSDGFEEGETLPLADFLSTQVSVLLRVRRANGWVIAPAFAGDILFQLADGPTLFGHRSEDVAFGAGAAVVDSLIHTTSPRSSTPLSTLRSRTCSR